MKMKIPLHKLSIAILFLNSSNVLIAQSVKKVETYYDAITKTRVHEVYTTLTTPPYPIHGVYKEFDQGGNLMNEISYQNGKKNGPHKVYINGGMSSIYGRENVGKLLSVTNYIGDEVDGIDQMFTYNAGKQQLVVRKFWKSGAVAKEESWYDDGKPKGVQVHTGTSSMWYPSGKKQQEVAMVDGLENGKVIEWLENGSKAFEGTFVKGKPSGEAYIYFPSGGVRRKLVYDSETAVATSTIDYYANGKVRWNKETKDQKQYTVTYYDSIGGYMTSKFEFLDKGATDMVLHGKKIEYEEDGSIVSEEQYDNGKGVGDVIVKDSQGNIVLQGQFANGEKSGQWLYYIKENGGKTNKPDKAVKFRKVIYKPGSSQMSYTDYYLTGEKMAEGFLRQEWPDQNVQFIKKYYKNGQVSEQGPFNYNSSRNVYDGKNGEWNYFYENGNLKAKGRFRLNEEYGVWEYYDEQGNLKESKRF